MPQRLLIQKFGKFGYRLHDLARGMDNTDVSPDSIAKSVSSETTLENNTRNRNVLAAHLLSQAQFVATELRKQHMVARMITLKIKTADFQRYTRSQTLA